MPAKTTGPGKKTSDKLLRCEILVLNRAAANNLLKSCLFPYQRDPSQVQIERYVGEMKRGWWVPGSPLYFAVLPNGSMYLLNGQHSLNAVVQSNTIQSFTAIYCGVKDLSEAGHLYSRFDIHRRRTWNDAYKAAGFRENYALDSSWISKLGSAIRLIIAGFNPDIREHNDALYSREIQLRIFETYIPYATAYYDALAYRHGKQSLVWRRAPVMAIGLELFKHQPKKAEIFFSTASADDGLQRDDPRKRLMTHLTYTDGHGNENRKSILRATMLAWNAFYSGDLLPKMAVSQVTDIRLLGTPWKSKDYRPFGDLIASLVAESSGTVQYAEMTTGEMTTGRGEQVQMSQYVGQPPHAGQRVG